MLTTSADTVLAKPAMIRSRSHLQTQKPLPPFLRRVEGSDGIRLLSADVTCSKTVENQHLFPCSVASKVNSFSANPPCPSFFSPRSLSPPSPSASLPADSASFSPSPTPPAPHPNPFPTRQRSRATAAAAGIAPLWVCPGLSAGGPVGPRSPGAEGTAARRGSGRDGAHGPAGKLTDPPGRGATPGNSARPCADRPAGTVRRRLCRGPCGRPARLPCAVAGCGTPDIWPASPAPEQPVDGRPGWAPTRTESAERQLWPGPDALERTRGAQLPSLRRPAGRENGHGAAP